MRLKNDKERMAFLEDYRNEAHGWQLWKDDRDTGRRMWRLDLDWGSSIVAEERLQEVHYPKDETKWINRAWYLVIDHGKPFENHVSSKTSVLKYIKQLKEFEPIRK